MFSDLPPVDFDARVVREGIKRLGALDEDIIQITDDDCDFDRLGNLLRRLRGIATENWRNKNKKTFFFFYYGGHAMIDSMTNIILNPKQDSRIKFPFESMIRNLGNYPGTFVIAVLDCSRDLICGEIHKYFKHGG